MSLHIFSHFVANSKRSATVLTKKADEAMAAAKAAGVSTWNAKMAKLHASIVSSNAEIVAIEFRKGNSFGRFLKIHAKNCFQLVNYGGHLTTPVAGGNLNITYYWRGMRYKPLIPTLSAALLLSFSLDSIYRYRPNLIRHIEESELSLLLDVFISESDALILSALRNLLFREGIVISPMSV